MTGCRPTFADRATTTHDSAPPSSSGHTIATPILPLDHEVWSERASGTANISPKLTAASRNASTEEIRKTGLRTTTAGTNPCGLLRRCHTSAAIVTTERIPATGG